MSNYNSLKATINANVKTNGNQEITGSVMNSVLNAMVNTLGAGYQYMGVASPATSPGSPDSKVFYLAATPGTYTNFNGLVVSDGEVAIFRWDSAWHKDVTGCATAARASQLEEKTDEINVIVGKRDAYDFDISSYQGYPYYVSSGGRWENAQSNVYTKMLPIGPGTYRLKSSSSAQCIYAILPSDVINAGSAVPFAVVNGVQLSSRVSLPADTETTITIDNESNARFLAVRADTGTGVVPAPQYFRMDAGLKIVTKAEFENRLSEKVDAIVLDISVVANTRTSGMIKTTGAPDSSTSWERYIIPNAGYNKIKMRVYGSTSYMAVAFYNSSTWGADSFMSSDSVVGMNGVHDYEVSVPAGCATIIVSNRVASLANPTITLYQTDISEYLNKIKEIESDVRGIFGEVSNDADLFISDPDGNVLAEFSGGGIKTKNFDSLSFTGGLRHKYFGKRIYLYQNTYNYKRRAISPTSTGSKQGFAIYDGKAFRLEDTGICRVVDLTTNQVVSTFNLGSYAANNHANVANFGAELVQDSSFPALYVSIGEVGASNAMQCAVEKINLVNGEYSATLLQTITLDTSGFASAGYIAPWSVPSFLIDKERGFLWTFSAKLRTTPGATGDFKNNVYVAHKYNIPDISLGDVTLTADDVLLECRFEFDVYVTQGGTMQDGKIYFSFGYGGTSVAKPALRVYDTDNNGIYAKIPISDIISEEPEDIAIFDRKLYVNTNSANIYELSF